MSEKVTALMLKEKFLDEASPLIDQYIDATFGRGKLTSTDPHCRKEVWSMLKMFLEKADEKIFLEPKYREGAEGIMLAVQDGVLSIEEGERLIDMHAKIKIMNKELPGVTANTLIPSLTINTLTAPPKQIPEETNDE